MPDRQEKANEENNRNKEALNENPRARVNHHYRSFLKKWWLLSWPRPRLMRKIRKLPRYATCGRLAKRPIFVFVSPTINPNDMLQVFLLTDDYSFGILQSRIHWLWRLERCSTLKRDFRYTSTTVYNSFPWPQAPSLAQVRAVARTAVDLRELRRDLMQEHGYTLRELYRTLELPGDNPLKQAHTRLDTAVRKAYKMKAKANVLESLFTLNRLLVEKEATLQKVVGPGLPPAVKDASKFITEDCIMA